MQALLRQGADLLAHKAAPSESSTNSTSAKTAKTIDKRTESASSGRMEGPDGSELATATGAKSVADASAATPGMSKKKSFDLNSRVRLESKAGEAASASGRSLKASSTATSSVPELDTIPSNAHGDLTPPETKVPPLVPPDADDASGFVLEDDDEFASAADGDARAKAVSSAVGAAKTGPERDTVSGEVSSLNDATEAEEEVEDAYSTDDSFRSDTGKPPRINSDPDKTRPRRLVPGPRAVEIAASDEPSTRKGASGKPARVRSATLEPLLPQLHAWGGGRWDETASAVAAARGGTSRDAFDTLNRASAELSRATAGSLSASGKPGRAPSDPLLSGATLASAETAVDPFLAAVAASGSAGRARASGAGTGTGTGEADTVVVGAGARPLQAWSATLAASTRAVNAGLAASCKDGAKRKCRAGERKTGAEEDEEWLEWLDGISKPVDRTRAAKKAGLPEFPYKPTFSASSKRLMEKVTSADSGDVAARSEAFVERREARREAELLEEGRRARILAKRRGDKPPPQWSRSAKGFFERQDAFLRRKRESAARQAAELDRQTRQDTRRRWDPEVGAIVEEEAPRSVWDAETREAFFARQQEAIDRLQAARGHS